MRPPAGKVTFEMTQEDLLNLIVDMELAMSQVHTLNQVRMKPAEIEKPKEEFSKVHAMLNSPTGGFNDPKYSDSFECIP